MMGSLLIVIVLFAVAVILCVSTIRTSRSYAKWEPVARGKVFEAERHLRLRQQIVFQAELAYIFAVEAQRAEEAGDYEEAEYCESRSDIHTDSLRRLEAEAERLQVF